MLSRMVIPSFFPVVRWVLLLQAGVLMCAGLVAWSVSGFDHAVSAWLGGLIAWLPNVFFSIRFGIRKDRRTAREVVRAFYFGEAVKLFLTAGLFTLAFQWQGLKPLPLFGGFILTLMVSWFALLAR